MIATVFRRTWAISKAETSLYMRNRSIALTALLFPCWCSSAAP